ncbi:MAG: RagB/SusD family nutrient uptake outer membrane protein [Saprospiraceae bacterium]|nr:MAG: RagB/SusD family protein [Bacteroidetes bacterium OLB9]MCO6463962.1 RagB/SusD family nutrient uptake outer membrane protein [Saprospiraceae bacterium]
MNSVYIKNLIVIVSLLLLNACSEDFLEIPVQGAATAESDPALAEKLVTGVYNSLISGDAFGNGDAHGIAFISLTNIISDDADKGSTPNDQIGIIGELDNFTHTPTNVFVGSIWKGHYNAISRCNQALKALETASVDDTKKQQFIGEVRFIRGYYYFNLVRWFGGVPAVLRVPESAADANSDDAFRTRASSEEIYNIIINDLQYAVDHLPLRNATQKGRINKGTAEGMLAKVYMYRKDWQKVFDLSSEVVNSGQFALLNDYAKIWRFEGNNSVESMFEIQTGTFNNTDFGVRGYCVWQGPRVGGKGGWTDLGFGFCTPSGNLVQSYDPADTRRLSTVIEIDNSETHKGTILYDGYRIPSKDSIENLYYNYKAYHSELRKGEPYLGNRDNKQKNIQILRYADILLMQAEAANELGQPDIAISNLNMLRARAGLAPVSIAGGTALRETIWNERRFELAMEHDRFFDIVRQGRAAEIMNAVGKHFVKGKHELLPIPALQIELSGGRMEQNPGY